MAANKIVLKMAGAFLALILVAALGAYLLTFAKPFTPKPGLPKLGQVADFTLTERTGKDITNRDLLGKVWVANFIFTACGGPCPTLSQHFAAFQKEIARHTDIRLVSFSVNPSGDTPPVLTQYATKYGADPQRWLFVTGEKIPLYTLIETSFKLVAQPNYDPKAPPSEKFIHSTRLVLVDRNGVIRGYYDGLLPETYPKLKADIDRLLKEPTPHATPLTISCPQCYP